jgi:His-Xaa-Ser system radical SAM maturase HxsB
MRTLLPFNFLKVSPDRFLLTNFSGDYYFISSDAFELLYSNTLRDDHPDYLNLKSRLFITDENDGFAIEKLAAKYRSEMSFLRTFTSLHMLVITLRCNQRCEYCQVSCEGQGSFNYDMTTYTAKKIIDTIFLTPSKNIKIEFQGGEPTLNWNTLAFSVLYAKQKNIEYKKTISFVLCTNLTNVTVQQLEFCAEHNIDISTSLDGPDYVHDKYRILRNKVSSYTLFKKNLNLARSICGKDKIDALMTTTSHSLHHLKNIIDEYINLDFNGIFIRSLNPYGFAVEENNRLSYSAEKFVDKYLNALDYIFEINRTTFFQEYFATLLFSRILTPFSTGFVDLQSPAGIGICAVIYDYDGNVFPSDEARMLSRMGDNYFCLGNVFKNSYLEIFNGYKLRNIIKYSCNEIIPTCYNCVYRMYCGADPVRNYLESRSIIRDMHNTFFCKKNRLIFNGLFKILFNISDVQDEIIWNWIVPIKHRVYQSL